MTQLFFLNLLEYSQSNLKYETRIKVTIGFSCQKERFCSSADTCSNESS